MSYWKNAAYASAASSSGNAAERAAALAVVTGGKSGIGLAIADKIAEFPFIDAVLAVSRSITSTDVANHSAKIVPFAADVSTEEGRMKIVAEVDRLSSQSPGISRGSLPTVGRPHDASHVLPSSADAPNPHEWLAGPTILR